MADRPFKAAIAADEKKMSNEISDALTKAINTSKVMQEANRLNGDANAKDWPKKPNGKVILYYDKVAEKAWKKISKKYRGVDAYMEIRDYAKGKPWVCCDAKYTGQLLGGSTRILSLGDTITGISKEVYGYEIYAEQIWKHNNKTLGNQCKQLPAGFAIELPKIFVPDWLKPPSAKIAAGAKVSAVDVPAPPLEWNWAQSKHTQKNVICGPVIVTVTITVEGSVKGVKTTPISPNFTFANHEAQFKKAVGPYEAGFNLAMDGSSETVLKIGLYNSKVSDLSFTGDVKLVSGGAQVDFGVVTTSKKVGDLSLSGEFKASAKVEMRQNPDYVSASQVAAANGAIITVGGLVLLAGGSLAILLGRSAATAQLPGGAAGLKEVIKGMKAGANVLRPCMP